FRFIRTKDLAENGLIKHTQTQTPPNRGPDRVLPKSWSVIKYVKPFPKLSRHNSPFINLLKALLSIPYKHACVLGKTLKKPT
ncbi:hypothetical protein RUM43_010414, partial [Polyplax serrata]